MAKYDVTHSCGHEVCHQLVGKHADRERKIEWLESVPCLECKREEDAKARAAFNQQSAAENAESGLPSLIGTEKQIAWAESIRKDLVARLDVAATTFPKKLAMVQADREEYRLFIDQVLEKGFLSIEESFACAELAIGKLKAETSASWWIEHREGDLGQLIAETAICCRSAKINASSEADAAIAEATIRPESPLTETVAEIRIKDKSLEIHFPEKRDDFWQIVKKQLRYEWAGECWRRQITIRTGSAIDRAAEAGNRLLRAGFVVRCFNDGARAMMLDASFAPECSRWVMAQVKGEYTGWFSLSWRREEDLYAEAKRLPGARYSKPEIMVRAEHFAEVLDFAEVNGFQLSPGARELVEQAKDAQAAALTAKPATPPDVPRQDIDRPDLNPADAGAIDADLLDD